MPDPADERDADEGAERPATPPGPGPAVQIEPGDVVRRNDDGTYSVVPPPP